MAEEKDVVNYTLTNVWNSSNVDSVSHSGNYLFLTNDKEIIFLENETFITRHTIDGIMYSKSAYNRNFLFNGIFNGSRRVWVTRFNDNLAFNVISNISMDGNTGPGHDSYSHYVYIPFYEFGGYYVFSISNVTKPTHVGNFMIAWHSLSVKVKSQYAFFGGDTRSGIADVQSNPISPKFLWKTPENLGGTIGSMSPLGTFAVSDRFFAYWTTTDSRFIIIPRINKTHCASEISVKTSGEYMHCSIIQQHFLVAVRMNKISVFEILENNQNLRFLSEIEIGEDRIIELDQINESATFYVVAGSEGLLKLTLEIDEENLNRTFQSQGYTFPLLLTVMTILTSINVFKRRK